MGQFATRITIVLFVFAAAAATSYSQLIRAEAQPLPNIQAVWDATNVNTLAIDLPPGEDERTVVGTPAGLVPNRTPKVVALPQTVPSGVKVGTTYYDFQTNASMPNRLAYINDQGDRFIQMVWMTSKDMNRDPVTRIPGFAGTARGSHYSFIDYSVPDEPVVGITEWQKIEEARAGWPSIAQFSDFSVGTPSHTPIRFYRNGGVGDDRFFEFSTVTTEADSALWPRLAVGGQDFLHLIYNRRIPGTPPTNQVVYRRSTDDGISWEPEVFFTGENAVLPFGANIGNRPGAGGDTYAITARGPNVAVIYSDGSLLTWVRKSTDFGATWDAPTGLRLLHTRNEMMIDSAETMVDGVLTQRVWSDTAWAPSSHYAIILDSDGNIHTATGQYRSYLIQSNPVGNPDARTGTIYSVNDDREYQNSGILYWAEPDTLVYVVGLAGGGEWDGEGTIVSRRGYSGGSRYPSMGIDSDDNIYLTYTSVKTGDFMEMQIDTTPRPVATEPDTLITVNGLYGHIYATHHYKGLPQFWSAPKDLTPDGCNSLFASLCDDVDEGKMYIGYSVSSVPGDRVTNVETDVTPADIYVMSYDVSSLNVISSVNDKSELDANVSISPNPANEFARIDIQSVTPGQISVSVLTMQGEMVATSSSPAPNTSWNVAIPTTNLASGAYVVLIEQNGSTTARTLRVVH